MNPTEVRRRLSVSVDVDTMGRDLTGDKIAAASSSDVTARSFDFWLPRIQDFFTELGIRATFFFVAEDVKSSPAWIRRLAEAGHEIASHSLTHPKQLASLAPEIIRREIRESKSILEDVLGREVVGFRAPGYTLSLEVFKALESSGYQYDASLNLSPSYNILKSAFRWLALSAGARAYIAVEPFTVRRPPYVFRPSRADYTRSSARDNCFNLIEIPIPQSRIVRWPLATSLLHAVPAPILSFGLPCEYGSRGTIPVELHDFEFADDDDYVQSLGVLPGLSLHRFLGPRSSSQTRENIRRILTLLSGGRAPEYRPLKEIAAEAIGNGI
jgi:hypothetical protein